MISNVGFLLICLMGVVANGDPVASPLEECDETTLCTTTGVSVAGAPPDATRVTYAVVAPVGEQTVPEITQASRLTTLDGKTIAVVGGSFMASVTHPEIRRLIQHHYPTARVILLNEIGSAGPFPPPGVRRSSVEEFQRNLREVGVDAVISGNGGCGLCTPKETGSSIAAEYLGIPAVTIGAPGFVEQIYSTAVNNGVPAPRAATYPGAFATHTREQLIRNTREVLWPQILSALTEPITREEIEHRRKAVATDARAIAFTGTIDEINRYFIDQRWSDGLPITPPTMDRVEAFLRFTDMTWDETVAVLPIAHRDTLVWHVAVNGVMAGCPPEFMPLLIAYTKALGHPSQRRSLASTHGWTPYCWVNGPVARQLGLDNQQGLISEPRNAMLGRFINLAMMNLAGYYIKQDRMGTFGYPMAWAMAEDEAACLRIGWKPYHVQQGFNLNDSTVTGTSALMWGNNLTPATSNPQKIMELIAWDAVEKKQFAAGSGRPVTYRTMLITEFIARDLSRAYPSKEHLEEALVATARRPAYERAFASYWASPGSAFDPGRYSVDQHMQRIMRTEGGALTDAPPWFPKMPGVEQIETVPVMQSGMTPILVLGDPDRNKVQTMPGGGYATVHVELPATWNELMAELEYRPLNDFFLKP